MSDQQTFDPAGIFAADGPINPAFIEEATRSICRSMPVNAPGTPQSWNLRRMFAGLVALTAFRPRDEIEVMLGVQAVSMHFAADACFFRAIDPKAKPQDSMRAFATAATLTHHFDTILKAIERRQAKPLLPPQTRTEPVNWAPQNPVPTMESLGKAYKAGDPGAKPRRWVELTDDDIAALERMKDQIRVAKENEGLDVKNIPGVLPGGGMIMPENPTPEQKDYLERRLKLIYDAEWADLKRQGIYKFPMVRPLRTGDYVP